MLTPPSRPPRRFSNDEQGSLIVALVIIMVVVTLGSVLASQVIGNGLIVVNRQNTSAGIAGADAGLSDALFRLDQGTAGTGTATSFCVKASDTNCSPGVPGAPGVSYLATATASDSKGNPTAWTIQSTGNVKGVLGAVQETVTRASQFPFVLFGNGGLNFNGQSGGFGTYTPGPASAENPSPCPSTATNPACVEVGSNGTISCNGGIPSSVTSVYFTGGGGTSSTSSSCPTPQYNTGKYQVPAPALPGPTPNDGCPFSAGLGTGFSYPTLSPGPNGVYVCTGTVTISGSLAITGDVKLYIMLSPATDASYDANKTPTLDIAAGSEVNTTINQDPPPANAQLPDPTQLEIFSNSTGTVGDSKGLGYYMSTILYAPNANLTGDGCKSVYYGSLVINTLSCEGGPHLRLYYDSDVQYTYGPWTASGYVQIPPKSVPNF